MKLNSDVVVARSTRLTRPLFSFAFLLCLNSARDNAMLSQCLGCLPLCTYKNDQ